MSFGLCFHFHSFTSSRGTIQAKKNLTLTLFIDLRRWSYCFLFCLRLTYVLNIIKSWKCWPKSNKFELKSQTFYVNSRYSQFQRKRWCSKCALFSVCTKFKVFVGCHQILSTKFRWHLCSMERMAIQKSHMQQILTIFIMSWRANQTFSKHRLSFFNLSMRYVIHVQSWEPKL